VATATRQSYSLAPSFTVSDLKRSVEFYRALGFNIEEEMKEQGQLQGVMLEAGGARLGLSQDDFAKGRDRVKGVGMRLYLETDDDIRAIAQRAKAAGVTLDSGPEPLPWGPMGLTVTDYDGFKLTIANRE
jgi:uncharacterized glyoxalase superfamily protein PhnB